MRRSLYLKDDDYRLSFLYGNFTTLTRFTEADLERVITERLSPLNVSIHATDPDVRARMLKNPRGGMSLRWLRAPARPRHRRARPDRAVPRRQRRRGPRRTLAGVLDEYPDLESVAVVPLGLSKFNTESAMRLHTRSEAEAVVDAVEDWQDVFLHTVGHRMVFAADEYYLMAGRPFPADDTYEGFAMHEDGIGMARTFEMEFHGRAQTPTGPQAGFFAAVDSPPNPAAYTGLRARACSTDDCTVAAQRASQCADRDPHRRVRRQSAPPVDRRSAPRRRAGGPRRQRVLRWQHRGHRTDGGTRPRNACWPTNRPATGICFPTCACRKVGSSTA